jgi:four helix bundle protein
LLVWQQAIELAASAYRLTRAWPNEELYGLTSQARRAATSVPANIAEGYGRENRGAYLQQGSLKELETHLLVAGRVEIAEDTAIHALLAQSESVGKLLRALMRRLPPD